LHKMDPALARISFYIVDLKRLSMLYVTPSLGEIT